MLVGRRSTSWTSASKLSTTATLRIVRGAAILEPLSLQSPPKRSCLRRMLSVRSVFHRWLKKLSQCFVPSASLGNKSSEGKVTLTPIPFLLLSLSPLSSLSSIKLFITRSTSSRSTTPSPNQPRVWSSRSKTCRIA